MIKPAAHPLVPGTAPVPDATPEHAETNMKAFTDAVAEAVAEDEIVVETPERDAASDTGDGRYGYRLASADGASVHILMPGAPLTDVRDIFGTRPPCLAINGTWWWWPSAITMAAGVLRG